MSNSFEICRHNLGAAPRVFGRAARREMVLKAPSWSASDPLGRVADAQPMLLERGRVAPAVLVQANAQLYAPGTTDSAALALWSEDARLETDLQLLRELAAQLFDYKGETPAEPVPDAMKPFANFVTKERARPLAEPLPTDWGLEGASFFLSALLVWRAHLPCGFLTSRVVPLLVLPSETKAAMILPGRFWADELKDR